jgi:hypothetical protein
MTPTHPPQKPKARRRTAADHARGVSRGGRAQAADNRTSEDRKADACRWNPDADDVQRSEVQLVLTLVELIRKPMECQAIRRMQERTLNPQETEAVAAALMKIERTVRDIGKQFNLVPEDRNLDPGGIELM